MVAKSGTQNGHRWFLAPCLQLMFAEADQRDPTRSHASDGSIGDADHQGRPSDHNPALADGKWWVCGADIDDDNDQQSPGVHLLRAHLVITKDTRVKYLIHEGTIWKARTGFQPEVYTGLNAHKKHLHISVHNTAAARNDSRPWWPQEGLVMDAEVKAEFDKINQALLLIIGEGRELDDDIPENLTDKVEQIQRNVTRIGKAAKVPNIEGTAT